MKFNLLRYRASNQSGIILLIVLWMMVILSLLAVGLGRKTSIDLSLAKHSIGKLKADYLAWAGAMQAINEIKKDTEDPKTSKFDTLYQCGVKIDTGKTPEDIFKHIEVGGSYFDVSYKVKSDNGLASQTRFGLQAEEGKINLNGINLQNYKVLSHLISLLGYDDDTAQTIAASVVDWHDADTALTNPPFGAEDGYYKNLPKPYPCKNTFFESVEEVLLVKGMTPEIFSKVRNYLTVFPLDATSLFIHINTAPEIVIRALTYSMTGAMTNTTLEDADSLTVKILNFRKGEDGQEFTSDDRAIDMNALNLNAKEQTIFLAAKSQMTDIANYLYVKVRGINTDSQVYSDIEAVINRRDLSISYWHKN